MKFAPLAAALALSLAAGPAVGDEPTAAFLDGLRSRGLADFALLELDRLAAADRTPADIQRRLPYERAVTLMTLAEDGGPAARARLDQAAALLERYAEQNPDGPAAGDAQFLRAEILQRAAADRLGAGDPAALPEEAKAEARRLLEDAGRVYKDARRKLEARLRQIGPFVDQKDDAARAERAAAEAALIRSRIEAARTTFRRAETYARGEPRRDRLLDEADAPLEDVRKEYRTKIGVLQGRLLQGDIRRARVPPDAESLPDGKKAEARKHLLAAGALYDEVYDAEPPRDAAPDLRDYLDGVRGTARRLKFAVLNHPLVADHNTVVSQATDWLAENRRTDPATGAAILLERGRAYENLDPPQLRDALTDYETAARRSAEVRGLANVAADRVRDELGLTRQEPETFREAYDAAQALVRKFTEQPADADPAEARTTVGEAARLLETALNLADARADPGEIGRTRYLLAFMNAKLGRNYEAAVLATDVAENFEPVQPDPDDPGRNAAAVEAQKDIPLEAAATAATAWAGAFRQRPEGDDGSFELDQLRATADLIDRRFPGSGRAAAVRLSLAGLLAAEGRYADAAEAYSKIPDGDPNAPAARLRAGDALWRLYLESVNAAEPPPRGELDALLTRAREALAEGVAATDSALPSDAPASNALIGGKLALARARNLAGDHAGAKAALTDSPRPVVGPDGAGGAIAVESGDRPARGVTSVPFANAALQALLRAQIGLKEIDAARDTIQAIQQVGAGGNVAVFVGLGKQIREELDRLPPGPERDAARENLVEFLDEVAGGDQTFGSGMWVAETYAGLAAALPDGSPRAAEYARKAAAALRGVRDSLTDPGFLNPEADAAAVRRGVTLRLAEALATAGDYEPAYGAVTEVLADSPNALNAQTTAADVLADWGESTGDADLLNKALRGDGAAWGWGALARRLAAQLAGADGDRFQADYNAARLRVPELRRALAETMSGEERNAELARAERDLVAWVTTTDPSDLAGDTLREAEDLYENLQRARGVADREPLPTDPGAAPPALADADPAAGDPVPAGAAADPGEADDGGPSVGLMIGLIVVAALVTAGAVFALRPKKKKRARRRSPAAEKVAAGAAAGGKTRKSRGAVRDSLPDRAPVPAAAPKGDGGPAGTDFPDFSNLPKKGAAATRTRRTRAAPAAASAAAPAGKSRRSASGSSAPKPAADGAKRARRPAPGGSSSTPKPSGDRPRKPRPKPDPPAE